MIVERFQHLVRSLNGLADGTPKKLVFFRIGGVSSSSRIEYEVKGSMVAFNDHVKGIDSNITHYLRGALDLEVIPNTAPQKTGGMRVDLFMVIWKSLANIAEDDAEQLFWGEPDVGIVRGKHSGLRVKDSIRSPFSRSLLDYYNDKPKPVQSFFVDHPEKDAESFYQQLLSLLAIGELECVLLGEDLPGETLDDGVQDAEVPVAESYAQAEIEELPDTILAYEPVPAETAPAPADLSVADPIVSGEQEEDDYIDSLINTAALERRAAKRNGHGKHNDRDAHGPDSLRLLFKGDTLDDDADVPALDDAELNLLDESLSEDLPAEYLAAEDDADDDLKEEDLDDLLSSFETAFDSPPPAERPTRTQKVKKIAGLQKMLKAAKKGF